MHVVVLRNIYVFPGVGITHLLFIIITYYLVFRFLVFPPPDDCVSGQTSDYPTVFEININNEL